MCVSVWEGGAELEPYLQSITGASLDVRPVRQHVERIYDLLLVSLFNMISVVRGRERVRKERKQREKGGCFLLRTGSCSSRRSPGLWKRFFLSLDWRPAGHMTTRASGGRVGNPRTRSPSTRGGCVYASGGVLRCLSQVGKRSGSRSERK